MATPLTPTAKVVPIVAPDMNDELQTQQQQHRRQRATSTRNVPAPLLECVSKRVQVISPDRQTLTPPPESTQHETTQNSKELLGSRRSSGSTPTSMTPRQLQATTTTTTGTQSPFGQHNNGVRMGWLEKYSLGRGPFSAFMRNWKRRYVVADHHGLKYYKSDKAFNAGKSPLGHVPFHGARSLQSVDDGSVRLFANITREMHDAAMRPATPKTGQVHTTPITTTSSSPSSSPHTTPTPSHVAAANGQQGNNGYVYFGLQFYECQHRYMLLFRTVDPREREAWRHFLSFFVPEGGRQQCTPQSSRRSSPAPRSTGAQALCESPIVKMEFAKARRKVLNWDDGTAAAFPTPFAGDGSPKDDPTCSTESSRNQTPVQQQHTSLNVLESDDGDDGDDDDDEGEGEGEGDSDGGAHNGDGDDEDDVEDDDIPHIRQRVAADVRRHRAQPRAPRCGADSRFHAAPP
eukprot:PhM_4_TR8451/c3_g1_i1/m.1377